MTTTQNQNRKTENSFAGWRGEDRALYHLSSVPHYPYTSDYGPGLPGRDWAAGRRTPNLRQPSLGSTHHRQAAQRPSFGDFFGHFLVKQYRDFLFQRDIFVSTPFSQLPLKFTFGHFDSSFFALLQTSVISLVSFTTKSQLNLKPLSYYVVVAPSEELDLTILVWSPEWVTTTTALEVTIQNYT